MSVVHGHADGPRIVLGVSCDPTRAPERPAPPRLEAAKVAQLAAAYGLARGVVARVVGALPHQMQRDLFDDLIREPARRPSRGRSR